MVPDTGCRVSNESKRLLRPYAIRAQTEHERLCCQYLTRIIVTHHTMSPQRIENETEAQILRRIDNEARRERRYERLFLRTLMTWFLVVVVWHMWPYIVNAENWPALMAAFRMAAQVIGVVAALLGGLVTLAWVGSGGQLFKDDIYE